MRAGDRFDVRGGAAKLDSLLSDNLAQPKPWNSRSTEEQAYEKAEKESRPGL
jgi:hypothetical protein